MGRLMDQLVVVHLSRLRVLLRTLHRPNRLLHRRLIAGLQTINRRYQIGTASSVRFVSLPSHMAQVDQTHQSYYINQLPSLTQHGSMQRLPPEIHHSTSAATGVAEQSQQLMVAQNTVNANPASWLNVPVCLYVIDHTLIDVIGSHRLCGAVIVNYYVIISTSKQYSGRRNGTSRY